MENFDLKEIHLKYKDLSKMNKVIPSSIHHAENINITAFVVYIYSTHFLLSFFCILNIFNGVCVCVFYDKLKLTRFF